MPHPCIECGQVFSFPYLLREHTRLHTGELPFVCGVCNKAFSRAHTLIGHRRTHLPPPPHASPTSSAVSHPCTKCPKVFLSASTLRKHLEVHDTALKCEYCSATFTRKLNLDRHMQRHGSQDDLQCVRCKRPFGTDVAKLLVHMKSHVRTHHIRT